jgi:hypothetical protein
MRILAVCFGLVLVASCAQVQTRTHYDRWAAAEREAAEPAPGPQPGSARHARPKAAAPARAASARSAGDTPEMRPGEAPRRGRALRPEDDEEDEEVIY